MIRAAGKLATVKLEPDTVVLVPDGSVVNTLDGVNTGPRILIAIDQNGRKKSKILSISGANDDDNDLFCHLHPVAVDTRLKPAVGRRALLIWIGRTCR